ncbi:serine acetyltransferase [Cupriavidus sp. L7L]|nr:serine acetyltransferase [Cupriavidus sp. L7L]
MRAIRFLFLDWHCNRHSGRIQFILFMYRVTSCLYLKGRVVRIFAFPLFVFYRVLVEWFFGCELPWKTRVNGPLTIYHAQGIVINPAAVIGAHCIIRHNTTIGARLTSVDAPIIGDHVDIGCGSTVLGAISIGSHAKIGAGSVVVHDVKTCFVVAGNPARPIRSEAA